MAIGTTSATRYALGILSLSLAFLGLLLFWLMPFGVLLSAAGVLAGGPGRHRREDDKQARRSRRGDRPEAAAASPGAGS